MSSVQPASTMAEGFALAIAATALAGATSHIGRFPPRVSASQTSLASSATTRTGPDNAMADTPPYKIRRATYPTPRKGRVKGLRTVFQAELSGRCLLGRLSAKRRNQQWIGPMCEQRVADGIAVGAGPPEAMPREQVGQSGKRRAILNAGDQILRGAQCKSIAADADHAGRRRVDG